MSGDRSVSGLIAYSTTTRRLRTDKPSSIRVERLLIINLERTARKQQLNYDFLPSDPYGYLLYCYVQAIDERYNISSDNDSRVYIPQVTHH